MKTFALALLLVAHSAHASVADFTYSLELDLEGLDASASPGLKGFEISFDGFQVDVARDCELHPDQKRLNCSGKGTVYPGLEVVGFRVKIPESLSATGNLEYRFEEQSGKTSLSLNLHEKKSQRAALAWEETAPFSEELATDAPIPLEAEAIVEASKPTAKPVAKKPGAQRATRQ